ncbi:hypothetical protein FDP41_009129 [Naegleria fowleri]|uniref:Uncharacterized protein n=1 Tax=Naegleria fowleri TaxID=5763 RepID=A0A6A5B300_NAEFO|nr:uncharacterized protein FDP41_009152 [Naegleria fowleri]XP_044557594.1 uncharacterized protein FDP41_009129 [Naegleria fowleri]KAF0972547.1 hypothetical protein FDP41_009152 [Naegleria fowleri]KAF0972880.1 hypothetical protein FDP41_009129 [Naegleria fowleri]CAG4707992.1 unnamed protein product [Naegleria fowleri]
MSDSSDDHDSSSSEGELCDRLGQLSVSENVTLRDVVRQYGLDNVVGLIDDLNEILRENKSSISAKAIEPKLYIIKISSLEVHTETNNAYRPCSGFMVAKVGKTEQFGTKRCDLIIAGLKKLGYEANLFKTSHAHEHESEKDYREKLAVFSVPYELLKKLGFDYTWGLTDVMSTIAQFVSLSAAMFVFIVLEMSVHVVKIIFVANVLNNWMVVSVVCVTVRNVEVIAMIVRNTFVHPTKDIHVNHGLRWFAKGIIYLGNGDWPENHIQVACVL